MIKWLLIILTLVTSNCCTYLFQTEYKGLVVSGGPISAAVAPQYDITVKIDGKKYEDSSRDTTIYQIGTVSSIYKVKYSSRCPLPDSVLSGSNMRKLNELKNHKDVKKLRVYHGHKTLPFSIFEYSIKDTSIVEIIEVFPSLIPFSNFGDIRFKPKKDGSTVLIAKNDKYNVELQALITVKNLIVMNTEYPSPTFEKKTKGRCKCMIKE